MIYLAAQTQIIKKIFSFFDKFFIRFFLNFEAKIVNNLFFCFVSFLLSVYNVFVIGGLFCSRLHRQKCNANGSKIMCK